MRPKSLMAFAIVASCATFNAHAAERANPCTLLDWRDIKGLGATKDTPITDAGWHEEKGLQNLADGKLFTNMCALTIPSKEGRTSVSLSHDVFGGNLTETQVTEWLGKPATEDPDISDVKVAKIDNTSCETGRYDLPTSQKDDSIKNVVEYYIACDQQIGMQHLSLNIHVPEGRKKLLPKPEAAKALLDKSIERMNKAALVEKKVEEKK